MENNLNDDLFYQQVKLILSKKRKQEAFKAVIAGAIFGTTSILFTYLLLYLIV
jgi:hypothetical protein